MRYIGLDVPYSTSTYCVLDANGQELQCETVRGHWPQLLERLRTVAGPLDFRGLHASTEEFGVTGGHGSHLGSGIIRSIAPIPGAPSATALGSFPFR